MSDNKDTLTIPWICLFFTRIGATAYGGPVSITNKIRRELVESRKVLSDVDFREALTLAHLMPGPLAIQVAIYIGWKIRGIVGGLSAAFFFTIPGFFAATAIAWGYVQWGGSTTIQSAFRGVSACVAALIIFNSMQLSKGILQRDKSLWVIALTVMAITLFSQNESALVFVVSGVVYALLQSKAIIQKRLASFLFISILTVVAIILLAGEIPALAHTALRTPPTALTEMFQFFFKSGALIFGSGLVIIPFMKGPLTEQFQWLTSQEFVDAVAVGFMTPGPALVSVAFMGYLIRGLWGAAVGIFAIFLPSIFYTLSAAPHYERVTRFGFISHLVSGISAAAVGGIAGAGIIIAKESMVNMTTSGIGVVTLLTLIYFKKFPEGLIVCLAGIAGIFIDRL